MTKEQESKDRCVDSVDLGGLEIKEAIRLLEKIYYEQHKPGVKRIRLEWESDIDGFTGILEVWVEQRDTKELQKKRLLEKAELERQLKIACAAKNIKEHEIQNIQTKLKRLE